MLRREGEWQMSVFVLSLCGVSKGFQLVMFIRNGSCVEYWLKRQGYRLSGLSFDLLENQHVLRESKKYLLIHMLQSRTTVDSR